MSSDFTYVRHEVKGFEHSRKTARFEIVLTRMTITDGYDHVPTGDDPERFALRLEERVRQFRVSRLQGPSEAEISTVVDRIPGSAVVFFRIGSGFGQRVYVNITYNWLGRWNYIRFDMEGTRGIFTKKLR